VTYGSLVTAVCKVRGTLTVHRDRERLEHEVLVDAPAGYVFRSSGVHQLVCAGADGTPLSDLYADAFERVSLGIEPCDDPECDVCHPEEEPS